MSFFSLLLIRLKQHLFAPKYLRQKNEQILGLKQDLIKLNDYAQQRIHELNQIKDTLTEKLTQQAPFLSYSQTGEDKILEILFSILNIEKPSYLDVGANYPLLYSNTYLLYTRGSHGVCIEPDPELATEFKKVRQRDTCLNIGVGTVESILPFYIFEDAAKGLNTFSKEQADYVESFNKYKVTQVKEIPVRTINSIIEENFDSYPNFLTIDVEGLDFEIIRSLNLERYPIDVICVESITHGLETRTEKKVEGITEYMLSKGYFIYADTHINTIYVNQKKYSVNNMLDE